MTNCKQYLISILCITGCSATPYGSIQMEGQDLTNRVEATYDCFGKEISLTTKAGKPALYDGINNLLIQNHWKADDGDHFLTWHDLKIFLRSKASQSSGDTDQNITKGVAIEYVLNSDRRVDALLRVYDREKGSVFNAVNVGDGVIRVSGYYNTQGVCFAKDGYWLQKSRKEGKDPLMAMMFGLENYTGPTPPPGIIKRFKSDSSCLKYFSNSAKIVREEDAEDAEGTDYYLTEVNGVRSLYAMSGSDGIKIVQHWQEDAMDHFFYYVYKTKGIHYKIPRGKRSAIHGALREEFLPWQGDLSKMRPVSQFPVQVCLLDPVS